jgi:ABC-type transport system substrate-binding protein
VLRLIASLAAALVTTLAPAQEKVLRYAFQTAETSFDPAYITDLYSAYVVASIFDSPLAYDYLARPFKIKPNTTELPEVSENGTVYTFRVKPGIYFADDAAFKGKKRELVAEDYVYSIKRFYDSRWKAGNLYQFKQLMKISGMAPLEERAKATGKFDYDMPCAGLQVLDRYTFRIKLDQPDYNFIYRTTHPMFSAVAREVVEKYGDAVGDHPVGTGPYRLAAWKRAARIVLERNPGYREETWQATAPPGDAWAEALAARQKGKRLPLIDRIEIAIVEETQPRWLAFLNEEHDHIERVPEEYSNQATPNGKLAANLARRGIEMDRVTRMELTYAYFNMDDPVVGGYTPERVGLRRAMVLGYDTEQEKSIIYKNQAMVAQSPIGPGTFSYDPNFRSGTNEHDPVRAKALLDMYGYTDRNGDGWREAPDGAPLAVTFYAANTLFYRSIAELWQKNMAVIGIKLDTKFAKWPDLLKDSNAGKLQMWSLGWSTTTPDAESFHLMLYGPNKGQANRSRFALAAYDRLFEKAKTLPHGPERDAVWREANRLFMVYAPWKLGVHRIMTNLSHPWVIGYRMNPAMLSPWKYVDIDGDLQKRLMK